MRLDINDVVGSEKYVGQKLWVCDYRKDIDKKATRHVKPTQVYIAGSRDFCDAGLEPRIYYSYVGFAKLKKNGEPNLKQLIPPFDTSGYRSYAGIGVEVYDNEEECIEAYNKAVDEVVEKYETELRYVMQRFAAEMNEIRNLKITKE